MVYTAILILAASALVRHANALPTQPAVDIDVHIDGIAQHPLAAMCFDPTCLLYHRSPARSLSARRDHGRGRPWRDDCQFYPGEERRPGYDCEHSQHWNYHRGYSNTDGPQKRYASLFCRTSLVLTRVAAPLRLVASLTRSSIASKPPLARTRPPRPGRSFTWSLQPLIGPKRGCAFTLVLLTPAASSLSYRSTKRLACKLAPSARL